MAVGSSSSQDLHSRNSGGTEPRKKMQKLRSIRLSKLPSLKPSMRRPKSRFDFHFIDLPRDDDHAGASSDHMKAMSNLDMKKEGCQEGSESEDISASSSAYGYGSSVSTPSFKNKDKGIKRGTKTKETLNKFGPNKTANSQSSRSSRREAKFKFDQFPVSSPDDLVNAQQTSLVESVDASPNYLRGTSSSDGRKAHFRASPRNYESSFDGTDYSGSSSHYSQSISASKPIKTLTRKPSLRTVRFLKIKNGFKSKRSLMKVDSEIPRYSSINRATCSSAFKGLKFPSHVELQCGQKESEGISTMKVCPYHHCSLNGHSHEPVPPLKHFISKRRHSWQTQKNIKSKSHSTLGRRHSGDKNPVLPNLETVVWEETNASTVKSFAVDKELDIAVEIDAKSRTQFSRGDGEEIKDSALAKILFGESSHPGKGLRENLNQVRNFLDEEQYNLEKYHDLEETCVDCHCITKKTDDSISMAGEEVAASNPLGNKDNDSIPNGKKVDLTDVCLPVPFSKTDEQIHTSNKEVPDPASEFYKDESSITENRSIQNCTGDSTENNCEPASTSDASGELSPNREQMNGSYEPANTSIAHCSPICESRPNAPLREACKHPLGKERHISMWYLIHQHMVSGLAAETRIQPLQGLDDEKRVDDGTTSTLPSTSDLSSESADSCIGMGCDETSNQEIELQKMYAIKLVREAIEKILLPEVQDQTSDDQSIKSDATTDQELLEINHEEVSVNGSFRECDNNKVVDDKSFSSQEESFTACRSPKEEKTAGKVENNSVKPNSWSNLKKLLVLRRFIKALEKVKKINPRKPEYLPLERRQEQEKVSLRHQVMDERRSAEEWMLDYALRQVVSQLAPTQKKKVSLLVKAFETVVPTQEDCHGQVSFPKLEGNSQKGSRIGNELDGSVSQATDGDQKAGQIVATNLGDGDANTIINDKQFNGSGCCTATVDDFQSCFQSDETTVSSHQGLPVDKNTQQQLHEDASPNLNSELLNGSSGLNGNDEELGGMQEVTGEPCYIIQNSSPDANVKSDATSNAASSTLTTAMVDSAKSETDHAIPKEFYSDKISSLNPKIFPGSCGSSNRDMELDLRGELIYKPQSSTPDGNQESTATEKIGFSCSNLKALKQLSSVREVVLQESHQVIGSKTDGTIKAQKTQLDKQNYIRMWHMIYQHVVSGVAAKVGNQLLLDESDDSEETDASNILSVINESGPCYDYSEVDHDAIHDNKAAIHQKIEFTRSDAVKLIQEEVDEILHPEVQDDSSDTQSNASDILPDQELFEKTHGDGGELCILNSTLFTKDSLTHYDRSEVQDGISLPQEDKKSLLDNTTAQEDEKSVSMVTKKPEQQKSKNWSKLKKLILLKRSIKALERSRKFSSQPPHNLSMTPEQEAEKVDLRHKMSEERKKAEQWMLDYAVQHIVTKLTPARKRKVAMLVEAFEAVVPMPDI